MVRRYRAGKSLPGGVVHRRRPGLYRQRGALWRRCFITGEVSEQTIHSAREQSLHFYAAGHHATERGGIRALSEWLTENTDLDVTFIDIPNPA